MEEMANDFFKTKRIKFPYRRKGSLKLEKCLVEEGPGGPVFEQVEPPNHVGSTGTFYGGTVYRYSVRISIA